MNVLVVLLETVITAGTASFAGAITAWLSIKLQTKSIGVRNHHLKHKENFEKLIKKIDEDAKYIFNRLRKNGINEFPKEKDYKIEASNFESDIFSPLEKTIDGNLYNDIEKHWPKFYRKLNDWMVNIKYVGSISSNISKAIFESIQNIDTKEVISIYSSYRSGSDRGTSRGYIDSESDCKVAIYNLVMSVSTENWHIPISDFEEAKIIDKLKELASKVGEENIESLQKVKEVENFVSISKDLGSELRRLILSENIRGKCEYIYISV